MSSCENAESLRGTAGDEAWQTAILEDFRKHWQQPAPAPFDDGITPEAIERIAADVRRERGDQVRRFGIVLPARPMTARPRQ